MMKTAPKALIWIIGKQKPLLQDDEDVLKDRFQLMIFQNLPALSTTRPLAILFDSALTSSLSAIKKASIPTLLLTESDDLESLRKAYRDGVSEILIKPLRVNDLITRLEKILHLTPSHTQTIQFDPIKRKVWGSGKMSSELTHRELQIFMSFHSSSKHTLKRQEIITQVWGNVQVGNKTLDVHLFNLRKKIFEAGFRIHFSPPDIFTLIDESSADKQK